MPFVEYDVLIHGDNLQSFKRILNEKAADGFRIVAVAQSAEAASGVTVRTVYLAREGRATMQKRDGA